MKGVKSGKPNNRHSRTRRDKRRANWKGQTPNLGQCPECKELKLAVQGLRSCGSYNGNKVLECSRKIRMRVALDAMGGDYAPSVNIEGAVETVNECEDIDVILVGDESSFRKNSRNKRYTTANRISVIACLPGCGDAMNLPLVAIRKKKDSSIRVGIELVKTGEADAFVSAGHSGVVMATSLDDAGHFKSRRQAGHSHASCRR